MGFKLQLNKQEVLKRTIPSLLIFAAAFVVVIIWIIPGKFLDSFIPAWLLGGFIWGWSLTKSWFPNFSFMKGFGGVLDTVSTIFRIMAALVVGAVALPIGLVITILTVIGIGKDARDQALAEAQANAQDNTQDQVDEVTPAEKPKDDPQE